MTRQMGQNRPVRLFAYRQTFDRPDNCTDSLVLPTGMPINSAVLPHINEHHIQLSYLCLCRHRVHKLTPNDYPRPHTERWQWWSAAAGAEGASCQPGDGVRAWKHTKHGVVKITHKYRQQFRVLFRPKTKLH